MIVKWMLKQIKLYVTKKKFLIAKVPQMYARKIGALEST